MINLKCFWHRRLGHYYIDDITKYLKLHIVKTPKCFDFKIAKLSRKPSRNYSPKKI